VCFIILVILNIIPVVAAAIVSSLLSDDHPCDAKRKPRGDLIPVPVQTIVNFNCHIILLLPSLSLRYIVYRLCFCVICIIEYTHGRRPVTYYTYLFVFLFLSFAIAAILFCISFPCRSCRKISYRLSYY